MTDLHHSVLPFQTDHAPASSSQSENPEDTAALELALTIARAADERKGADIRILKVTDVSYLADYFVIITGFSAAQVRAIARSVEEAAAEQLSCAPIRSEGLSECNWVLHDYGDVIAHIFRPDEREFYGLEAFWGHAEEIPFESEGAA